MSTIYKYNNYILKPLTRLTSRSKYWKDWSKMVVVFLFKKKKQQQTQNTMLKVVDTSNRNVPSAGFSSFLFFSFLNL